MRFGAYVVLSAFLANVSSDAMLHRVFIILLILSGGGNSMYVHIYLRVCISMSLHVLVAWGFWTGTIN